MTVLSYPSPCSIRQYLSARSGQHPSASARLPIQPFVQSGRTHPPIRTHSPARSGQRWRLVRHFVCTTTHPPQPVHPISPFLQSVSTHPPDPPARPNWTIRPIRPLRPAPIRSHPPLPIRPNPSTCSGQRWRLDRQFVCMTHPPPQPVALSAHSCNPAAPIRPIRPAVAIYWMVCLHGLTAVRHAE